MDFAGEAVKIKEGEITKGIIDKNLFGDEEGLLIKEIDKKFGRNVAFDTIRKAFNLGKNYLTKKGITISLEDFDGEQKDIDLSEEIVKRAEEKTKEIIGEYNSKTLEVIQGKTPEESREIKILKVLNEVRTRIGEIVKAEFPEDNPVTHMIRSGGGGNILNITQMACCVGQQDLEGKRIDIGFNDRTLSFFRKGDLSPKARGFIRTPFIKGLRPDEFFFGAMTGRATLMDTALRTPRSGYLYRRLANALQDLRVEYDKTVRDSNNNVIQFKYGDDGRDVTRMHTGEEIEPGEAIGIVTAQSFGEPSSPKMEIYLKKEYNNERDARVFAEKIKEIIVSDIFSKIDIDFSEKKIEIKIDREGMRQTHISLKKIVDRLKELGFNAREKTDSISVSAPEMNFREIYKIKEKLKKTIISGIKGIKQILIVKREND